MPIFSETLSQAYFLVNILQLLTTNLEGNWVFGPFYLSFCPILLEFWENFESMFQFNGDFLTTSLRVVFLICFRKKNSYLLLQTKIDVARPGIFLCIKNLGYLLMWKKPSWHGQIFYAKEDTQMLCDNYFNDLMS